MNVNKWKWWRATRKEGEHSTTSTMNGKWMKWIEKEQQQGEKSDEKKNCICDESNEVMSLWWRNKTEEKDEEGERERKPDVVLFKHTDTQKECHYVFMFCANVTNLITTRKFFFFKKKFVSVALLFFWSAGCPDEKCQNQKHWRRRQAIAWTTKKNFGMAEWYIQHYFSSSSFASTFAAAFFVVVSL